MWAYLFPYEYIVWIWGSLVVGGGGPGPFVCPRHNTVVYKWSGNSKWIRSSRRSSSSSSSYWSSSSVVFVCRRRKSSAAHPRDSRGNGFKNKFRQTNISRVPLLRTRTLSSLAPTVIVFFRRVHEFPAHAHFFRTNVIENIKLLLLLLTLSLLAVAINNEFFVFVRSPSSPGRRARV